MHSAPFGCRTKLGPKRAELVQKFVPCSLVRIFCNERTQSTPLDPKLMFWCISYDLGAFRAAWLPYETRCKTGRTSAQVRARMSRWNFSQRTHHWTLNWHFGAFHIIWVHSEPFGCLTKLGAKQAELVQKFVPQSRVGIFWNERTRTNPLDPKLTFWCVSYSFGAFGTVWLPYETRCKTGRTSLKGRATKSRQIFSQRTHPIHPIGP